MTDTLKPCEHCDLTGFTDKVRRGMWTMQPREKLCQTCGGRGWVAPPPRPKAMRGFALLDAAQRKAMARLGGASVPGEKRGFSCYPGLAKTAGAKGGGSVPAEKRTFSTDRELARRAGQTGGRAKRTQGRALRNSTT
jgi:general stress protein YciG